MPLHQPQPAKLALVMVGLPARGKTYTARKIARYLAWLGYRSRVFNVGNYRRAQVGAQQPASFFDPENPDALTARKDAARAALDDLLGWLEEGGDVAIYDATNSTVRRRRWVHDRLRSAGVETVFVEFICEDPEIIEANIRETKVTSPDYAGLDPDTAVQDFRARIAHYERAYEPMDTDRVSYIKLIDVNRRLVTHDIRGYLPGRVVFFLMNLHIVPRTIWLTRHGESDFNLQGRIGGDAGLTEAGAVYARSLRDFIDARVGTAPLEVWTSSLRRSLATAEALDRPYTSWRALDEIGAGQYDGLTYAEIATRFPEEHAARQADKLRYRYPRGESYQDVMQRLEPVLLELERQQDPVLVISHQAVMRALYGYFLDVAPGDIPHLDIPLHTVMAVTPKAYGAEVRRFPLAPAVPDSGSS